jgi:hypothetical protein
MITSMILITSIDSQDELSKEYLKTWVTRTSWGLGIVPFAGIAFLWFTGVIRDRLGDREDKLFATVF